MSTAAPCTASPIPAPTSTASRALRTTRKPTSDPGATCNSFSTRLSAPPVPRTDLNRRNAHELEGGPTRRDGGLLVRRVDGLRPRPRRRSARAPDFRFNPHGGARTGYDLSALLSSTPPEDPTG